MASSEEAAHDTSTTVKSLHESIASEKIPLPIRFRALFSLKHLAKQAPDGAGAQEAVDAIAAAFASPSALLKHEVAYCLGQTGKLCAVSHLRNVLSNLNEDAMVRHESAEALGALGSAENLDILLHFRDREGEDVAVKETCEIAIDRIGWENSQEGKSENLKQSDFASVDPAPPMPQSEQSIEELGKNLMDKSLSLFRRYRAMFALRDLASPPHLPTAIPAIQALARGFGDASALFRHEIAFVFGQLSHPASIPALTSALSNEQEASMVRHEAAEALGSLGKEEGIGETLRCFLHDKEKVVRESVIVALDISEYEKGEQTEYALIPERIGTSGQRELGIERHEKLQSC